MEGRRRIPFVLPFPPGEARLTIIQQMANLRSNPNIPDDVKWLFWNRGIGLNGRLAIIRVLKRSRFGSWISTTYADELFNFEDGYITGSHVAGSVFSCRLIIGVGVEVMLRLNGLLDLLYIRVIVPRKQWIDEWKDVIRIGKSVVVFGDMFAIRHSICLAARVGYPPREPDVIQID